MTVDPLWPEEPAFAYSNCSPLSYLDPTGLRPSRDLWGLCFREGIGTCYSTEEGFKNCCTKCGQCFTKEMECSNSVAAFPGSGFRCGDILLCCSKKVCVVVVVKDTGSGGPGRIIDFGCCFSKKVGLSGLEPITCFKVGTKKLKRECNTTEQCERKYGPAGKFCPREKKKKK